MRTVFPAKLEAGRVRSGELASSPDSGGYGAFMVPGPCGERLMCIASGGDADDVVSQGWEHVSVSTRRRIPNWTEMSFVKDLFWDPEECVVEFHPPRSEYVNNRAFVLHLWRNKRVAFPMPPSIMVGVKSAGLLDKDKARALRDAMGVP